MAIEGALRAYLLDAVNNPTNNIATEVGTAIYPVVLPKSPTYPCVVITPASRAVLNVHSGATIYDTRRIQFDTYAETLGEAQAVADKITGSYGARTSFTAGTGGDAILAIQESHAGTEFPEWDDTLERWRIVQDYLISF